MKIGATSKPKCAARALLRRLTEAPAKLKGRARKMYAAHEARVASLRVFDSTRPDGAGSRPDTGRPVPSRTAAGKPAGVADTGESKLFERLKTRIRRWYRAHEARVSALRVYSRNRIDRGRQSQAGR